MAREGAVLALLLLALPAPASAATAKQKVAVLVVGADPSSAALVARLERAAASALGDSSRFELLSPEDALDPAGARARKAKAEEGRAALADATKAYNDLDTERAARLADQAMAAYEASDLSEHFDDYISAWLMRAASLLANGDKRADRELERLLAIAPRAQLSAAYFAPEALAQAERARRNLSLGSPPLLEVRTSPARAEIWVDGRPQGAAPVVVKGLAAGEHWITARAPGFALQQQRARDGIVNVALRPLEKGQAYAAAQAAVARTPAGKERDLAACDFARAVGASQVLLAVARKATTGEALDYELFRMEISDAHNAGYQAGIVPSDPGLENAFRAAAGAVLARDVPRVNGLPVSHFPRPAAAGADARLTGYALLGTGAALLVAGAFCGVEAFSRNAEYRHTSQTDPLSPQLASTGMTFAVSADVLVIAGLASAGVGAFLGFAPGEGAPRAERGREGAASHDSPPPRRHEDEDLRNQ